MDVLARIQQWIAKTNTTNYNYVQINRDREGHQ